MTVLTLVRAELARLVSSRMSVAALVALMTVPVVYGGLYLWGNADPYGELDRVPAAIVVADRGATIDGEAVDLGRDAADELLDDGSFDWHEVSTTEEAEAGVRAGDYDFAIEFPAGFSADLASATGDEPTAARIRLVTDDSNGYLSSTLAGQAAEAVRSAIVGEVSERAASGMLEAIADLRDGLVEATDGAADLADGAHAVATGAGDAATGAASLADGAGSLDAGLSALAAGAASLPDGATALDTGAAQIASGLSAVSTPLDQLTTVTGQAAALSPALRAQVAQALAAAGVPDEQSAPLLAQFDQLSALTAGGSQLASGIDPNVDALATGAAQLADGAHELASQAPTLVSGLTQAAAGAAQVDSGAAQLSAGAVTLADGAARVDSGAAELRSSLADGVAEVPETTAFERADTAAAIADPVSVDRTAIAEAQNYGAGLAPFFISLAAWIGIYALFLLVRPLSRRALSAGRAPVRTALAGWLAPAALGAVQMVALFAIVTGPLGLRPENPLGLLAFMVLVSAAFAAIVHALNVWLGSVGQFLGLLLMIVQLVTAGGTFPWQTLPAPLAALHHLLPMAHAVDGIRDLIYGGGAALGGAIAALAGWLVVALALSALGAVRQSRHRTLRDLRPSPIAA